MNTDVAIIGGGLTGLMMARALSVTGVSICLLDRSAGDHGMADVGHHGGTTDQERYVPFWDIGHPRGGIAEGIADQTSVATTILDILGVEPAPIMKGPSLAH